MQDRQERLKHGIGLCVVHGVEIHRFLLSCKHVFIDDADITKTVGTDCISKVWYNTSFFDRLSIQELVFVLVHEVYHCALSHQLRLGKKDVQRWNVACDFYINANLVRDNVGKKLNSSLYSPSFEKMTPQEIYTALAYTDVQGMEGHDDHDKEKMKGEDIDGFEVVDFGGDPVQIEEVVEGIKTSGTLFGKGLADLEKGKKKESNSDLQKNWSSILRGVIPESSPTLYSYARSSKKASEGIILPRQVIQNDKAEVHIAVDVSGSIGRSAFEEFLDEMVAILKLKKIEILHVYLFNCVVEKHITFKSVTALKSKVANEIRELPYYSGGTDFMCVFDMIKKKPRDFLIFFTDGYPAGSWGLPVSNLYYVVNTNRTSPIGKTLFLKQKT